MIVSSTLPLRTHCPIRIACDLKDSTGPATREMVLNCYFVLHARPILRELGFVIPMLCGRDG